MTQGTSAHARLLLIGAGNVGRRFLELLARKRERLENRFGLTFSLVGVADSIGAATAPNGLNLERVIALKNGGRSVADYPGQGRLDTKALEMVQLNPADLLVDASPANLEDGQPGLDCIEAALSKGMHVVTANKAPLVLAYPRLKKLADERCVHLRFDATVAGGLPAVNLGRRDLSIAEIHRLEGVLNLTTNYILTRMAQDGLGYDQALALAQEAGHAEADPILDVEGWDAASKLVILAQGVLRHSATLNDVAIEGITNVTAQTLQRAAAQGKRIKLLAIAERDGDGYRLSVRPTRLEATHPMARLGPKQMGIVYHTDICGVVSAAIVEETPIPTASAVLRDIVDIYSNS
jgi:homoserine dehydrogenase